MKKIKRVALIHASGEVAYFPEEYPYKTRDIDILNVLYEVGKSIWYDGSLYKVTVDAIGNVYYHRYEIYTVKI